MAGRRRFDEGVAPAWLRQTETLQEHQMSINPKMLMQMQNRIAKIQQELAETVIEGTAGGGIVTVQVSGAKEFIGIKIDPSAVDPDDVELLEDIITVAVKDAMAKAQTTSEEKLGVLTAGLNIPGLM
jgi:DNA-binding YbaB/EbfC family protein